jgi:DnaK suppressor protein
MSPEQREQLISALQARRLASLEALRSLDERAQPVELDQTVQGRVSRIDAITQQQMARASKARLKLGLERIDAALARDAQGRYGLCCRCHEPIEPRRLQADPGAPHCMDCLQELVDEAERAGRRH